MKHPFFIAFFAVLLLAAGPLALLVEPGLVLILAFDFAAAVFLGFVWWRLRAASPDRLRQSAADNDGGRGALLATACLILLAIMVAVALEMQAPQGGSPIRVVLAIVTLTLAWFFANVVFAIHYAHMFYDRTVSGDDREGLDFPGHEAPDFNDFAYFALVLGMTFQVSDVQITSRPIRKVATVHGLAAFFYNLGVLALSINIVGANLVG